MRFVWEVVSRVQMWGLCAGCMPVSWQATTERLIDGIRTRTRVSGVRNDSPSCRDRTLLKLTGLQVCRFTIVVNRQRTCSNVDTLLSRTASGTQ